MTIEFSLVVPSVIRHSFVDVIKESGSPEELHFNLTVKKLDLRPGIVALSSTEEVVISIAAGIASGGVIEILKFIWNKLYKVAQRHQNSGNESIVIVINGNGNRIEFDVNKLPPTLPDDLENHLDS